MSLSIRQIHPVFVGEVSGIDLARPLSRDEVAAIEAGMDRYAVLVFRDQRLTDEQQMAFSRNFGPLEDGRGRQHHQPGGQATPSRHERRLEPRPRWPAPRPRRPRAPLQPRQHDLALGQLVPPHPRQVLAPLGAYGESRGAATPSSPTCARPTTRSTPATQALIGDLVCEHSLMYSAAPSACSTTRTRSERCSARFASGSCARIPSPAAGRSTSPPTPAAIVDMPMPEARILLRDLNEHATQPASSTSTSGARGISSSGTTGRPCTACAATTRTSRATCGARPWPARRPRRLRWRPPDAGPETT